MKEVIVITGGSSGYGKGTAKKFAENGYQVIITGRNIETLEAAAKEIGADAFRADATDPADWERLHAYVMEKYGRIDLLLNNAGGGISVKDIQEQTLADIDKIITLNLNSVIYGCRAFAETFIAQGFGTILTVASACAKHAWPGFSVYAASKWGVLGFTKGLATELGPKGIRVGCLIPGAGDTNFSKSANLSEPSTPYFLRGEDAGEAIYAIYNLPKHVWVEEMILWGMDQVLNPL